MKKIVRVAAALIIKDDTVLLTKRPEGKFMAGLYELPGGKLEEGEDAYSCIVREIKEELNLDIKTLSYFSKCYFDYADFTLDMDVILCQPLREGDRVDPQEGQDFSFFKVFELDNLSYVIADYALIPKIKDYMLTLKS